MKNGVSIYGGFAGTENILSQRDWNSNSTILSGDIGTINNITDNSNHVVSNLNLDNTAVLDGFVVRDGYHDVASGNAFGAGMVNRDSFSNHCAIAHLQVTKCFQQIFLEQEELFIISMAVRNLSVVFLFQTLHKLMTQS